VIVAAVFVMFMQAGFLLLEIGFSRMKNAGAGVAKVLLNFSISSIAYWAVGFALAFGGSGWFAGNHGFFLNVGHTAEEAASKIPLLEIAPINPAALAFFQFVFCAVSLAIVWGTTLERIKFGAYLIYAVVFSSLIYPIVSHWIFGGGWLAANFGMQDFAGSTVVHLQGALAALAGALLLGPRIGRFGRDGRAHPIPGHNMPYAVLGTLILWFGWFGFNPGSTLGIVSGERLGYFGYVALTTNLAAAAGALGGIGTAWLVLKKPDIGMMLNGVIAALVAITAASGFVAPWAAIVIGAIAGAIAVYGVLFVEHLKIDDPIGAVAVHGFSGVWGTLATGIFAVPALAANLATGSGGLLYTGSFHQLGVQALGIAAVAAFTFTASFSILWTMKALFGIRAEAERETAGLDVSEHGQAGYPELYPRLYELQRVEESLREAA
jgi:Amt family ammonium transporter